MSAAGCVACAPAFAAVFVEEGMLDEDGRQATDFIAAVISTDLSDPAGDSGNAG